MATTGTCRMLRLRTEDPMRRREMRNRDGDAGRGAFGLLCVPS